MEEIRIKLGSKHYFVIDSLNHLTLADSFVLNKIGTGHGEGKLYVGNESQSLLEFFDNFNYKCIATVFDFTRFLHDASSEYLAPKQEYRNKQQLGSVYYSLLEELGSYPNEVLLFNIFRSKIKPPRVYINSDSDVYKYFRRIGLPNISYVSIMKLKDDNDEYFYYFKIFLDNNLDILKYEEANKELEKFPEKDSNISDLKKQTLVNARIGQGKYRQKLLEECMFCPFTLVNDERLLIASHIKPWSKSNNKEKIDYKNGFLFTPTFDKLFDQGFISFNDDKTLIVSPWLSPMNRKRLGITNGKKIEKLPLDNDRQKYLKYHRENILNQ